MSAAKSLRRPQRKRSVPALRQRLGPLTATLESVNYDKWPSGIQASERAVSTRPIDRQNWREMAL